jgi:hypothetical protein
VVSRHFPHGAWRTKSRDHLIGAASHLRDLIVGLAPASLQVICSFAREARTAINRKRQTRSWLGDRRGRLIGFIDRSRITVQANFGLTLVPYMFS